MKTTEGDYSLGYADWSMNYSELYEIRRAVFVEEQDVPEDMERDEYDAVCWHVLARDSEGRPIGTGRLLPDGHIGRLAVLKSWRGRGVGKALMVLLLKIARRQGFTAVELNAQTHAVDFYQTLGFRAQGEEFLDAGIPHRRMRLRLRR